VVADDECRCLQAPPPDSMRVFNWRCWRHCSRGLLETPHCECCMPEAAVGCASAPWPLGELVSFSSRCGGAGGFACTRTGHCILLQA
jgi:hypothetical protein